VEEVVAVVTSLVHETCVARMILADLVVVVVALGLEEEDVGDSLAVAVLVVDLVVEGTPNRVHLCLTPVVQVNNQLKLGVPPQTPTVAPVLVVELQVMLGRDVR